jgi:hypothetical protein
MTVTHRISEFDLVELIGAIEVTPAGSRGGMLELHADDTAMIEMTKPDLGPAARIVFVPLGKLRPVESAPGR